MLKVKSFHREHRHEFPMLFSPIIREIWHEFHWNFTGVWHQDMKHGTLNNDLNIVRHAGKCRCSSWGGKEKKKKPTRKYNPHESN